MLVPTLTLLEDAWFKIFLTTLRVLALVLVETILEGVTEDGTAWLGVDCVGKLKVGRVWGTSGGSVSPAGNDLSKSKH